MKRRQKEVVMIENVPVFPSEENHGERERDDAREMGICNPQSLMKMTMMTLLQ